MPSFQEVGFLSEELEQFRENVRAAHQPAFRIADRVNRIAMRMLWELPLSGLSAESAYFVAAFARAVQGFQCVLILTERGAEAEARTLLRSLAETVFLAVGMFKVPDMVDRLHEDNARHRRALANRMIQLNRGKEPPVDVSRFEQELVGIAAEYPNEPRGINWSWLSGEVGLVLLYEAAYRFTSGDAAHATLESLNRHMEARDGELHQFVFNPSADDIRRTFRPAVAGMFKMMEVAAADMGLGQYTPELREIGLEAQVYRDYF